MHGTFLGILLSLLLTKTAFASETANTEQRLSGFAEHQSRQTRYDKAREKGEREYLEEKDQFERQAERALEEYKKTKKPSVSGEDTPEALTDAAAKKKRDDAYQEAYQSYLKEKSRKNVSVKQRSDLPTEAEELDLFSDRPRYDVKNRIDYGGSPKFGRGGSGARSGGGGSGGYVPPVNTTPSQPYQDFEVDPPMVPDSEEFGDIPPPPPPLPPGFGGDDNENDFPIPPPPPPMFDDGF